MLLDVRPLHRQTRIQWRRRVSTPQCGTARALPYVPSKIRKLPGKTTAAIAASAPLLPSTLPSPAAPAPPPARARIEPLSADRYKVQLKPGAVSCEARGTVFERDGEQCAYLDARGHRCPARAFLKVDHTGSKTAQRVG